MKKTLAFAALPMLALLSACGGNDTETTVDTMNDTMLMNDTMYDPMMNGTDPMMNDGAMMSEPMLSNDAMSNDMMMTNDTM